MHEEGEVDKRTIPEVGVDTQRLYERLIKVPVDELVSYAELSRVIGRDVQKGARGNLQSARRIAQRTNSMLFEPVRNEGLRNLPDVGKCRVGGDLSPIRRVARRKARALASVVSYDTLPEVAKIQHNTGMAVCGAVALMTKPSEIKRVSGTIAVAQRRLSVDETIKLFAPPSA